MAPVEHIRSQCTDRSFSTVVAYSDNSWAQAVEEQLKNEFTDEQRAKAWDNAAKAVKTHHDELVKQWQDTMDSILVYVRFHFHEVFPPN